MAAARGKDKRTTAEISPAASQAADLVADRVGLKKKTYVERLLLWMAQQPDAIQKAAAGLLVEGFEQHILELVVAEMRRRSGDTGARIVVPPNVYMGLQAKAEKRGKTLEQYLADLAGNPRRLPRLKPDHLAADTRGDRVKFHG